MWHAYAIHQRAGPDSIIKLHAYSTFLSVEFNWLWLQSTFVNFTSSTFNKAWVPLCVKLTIRVQLVSIRHQPAVIPVVRDTVIVIVMVTDVSLPILVVVGLVAIGDVGAVVQRVLVAVFVNVIVVVTHVPHKVTVRVELHTRTHTHINIVAESSRLLSIHSYKCVCACVSLCSSLPVVGYVAEDSCHTGLQLRPGLCLSGQCYKCRDSCRGHSEPLQGEKRERENSDNILCGIYNFITPGNKAWALRPFRIIIKTC